MARISILKAATVTDDKVPSPSPLLFEAAAATALNEVSRVLWHYRFIHGAQTLQHVHMHLVEGPIGALFLCSLHGRIKQNKVTFCIVKLLL